MAVLFLMMAVGRPLPTKVMAEATSAPAVAGGWSAINVSNVATAATAATLFVSATWPSPTTCVAVGTSFGQGVMWLSSNGGSTWQPVAYDFTAPALSDVASATVNSITYTVAVSTQGKIYGSSDGGFTYAAVYTPASAPQSWFGVAVGSNGNVFAVGLTAFPYNPVVYRSTPLYGFFNVWNDFSPPVGGSAASSVQLTAVSTKDGNNVYVTGAGGTVYYSNNAGSTWALAVTNTTNTMTCVSAASGTVAMAAGLTGPLLLTTNAGKRWVDTRGGLDMSVNSLLTVTATIQFHAITMLTTQIAYVATTVGVVFKTTNAGGLWTLDYPASPGVPTAPLPCFSALAMYSPTTGVAGTCSGGSVYVRSAVAPTPRPTFPPAANTRQPTKYPTAQPSKPVPTAPSFPTSQPTGYISMAAYQWNKVAAVPTSTVFYSASWATSQVGIVVGKYSTGKGVVVRTMDGGSTWTPQMIGVNVLVPLQVPFPPLHPSVVSWPRFTLDVRPCPYLGICTTQVTASTAFYNATSPEKNYLLITTNTGAVGVSADLGNTWSYTTTNGSLSGVTVGRNNGRAFVVATATRSAASGTIYASSFYLGPGVAPFSRWQVTRRDTNAWCALATRALVLTPCCFALPFHVCAGHHAPGAAVHPLQRRVHVRRALRGGRGRRGDGVPIRQRRRHVDDRRQRHVRRPELRLHGQ